MADLRRPDDGRLPQQLAGALNVYLIDWSSS